ncbi:MAG: phospholipase D-like domain-containing protein [Gammaproteobacteria bacterium]|nr:phospholipase D-like domain-containing protein [Gammaproteobacteria bacterium]
MSTKKTYYCNANPAQNRPYVVSQWFIPPPSPSQYTPRGGNQIHLLNCGDEYLPALYTAIDNARQSIYITIWGFNPHVSLRLNSTDPAHELGAVLQRKAESGVAVKILVWHNLTANVGSASAGDSSLHNPLFRRGWNQRAMAGEFDNLEFITRDPGRTALSPQTRQALANIDQQIEAILGRKMLGGRGYRLSPADQAELNGLKRQRKLLKKVGQGAYQAQNERIEDGISYGNIGKFPTHHQKTVLIDHELCGEETGFVQGFNFWPKYFDESDHPYRGKNNRMQDVGLRLKGHCLIDIYHNFAQSWNQESDTPIPEQAPLIKSRGVGGYTCQILRTWRMNDEFNILAFYENAFTKLNHFIYVEDQYFRQPEFARGLKKRAEQIRSRAGNKKQLHVFVVTNLNKAAAGEIDVRQGMLDELSRSDTDAGEAEFKARMEDDEAQKKIKQQMEKSGVMVHICRLRNSQVNPTQKPSGRSGRHWDPVHYGDTYVHSKLTIFDDAYLTLGSANWNHRSMTIDTELNIAVQLHDDAATTFRNRIWAKHTNGLMDEKKTDGSKPTPPDWYKDWDELLRENYKQYTNNEPLLMNLFPYYEDIDKVRKSGIINEMKQKEG